MTIEINPNQDALHLSLSETTLQHMCHVQKLTATNRKKILALLDKALPELVQGFLDESVEVQGLITKNPITTGFKPVYVNFEKPLALWGEEDGVALPDGTVFYVDGYSFGDRLLERVMFKCALLDGGTSGVVFGPEYDAYTASLNMKMWMNLCAEQLSQRLCHLNVLAPSDRRASASSPETRASAWFATHHKNFINTNR